MGSSVAPIGSPIVHSQYVGAAHGPGAAGTASVQHNGGVVERPWYGTPGQFNFRAADGSMVTGTARHGAAGGDVPVAGAPMGSSVAPIGSPVVHSQFVGAAHEPGAAGTASVQHNGGVVERPWNGTTGQYSFGAAGGSTVVPTVHAAGGEASVVGAPMSSLVAPIGSPAVYSQFVGTRQDPAPAWAAGTQYSGGVGVQQWNGTPGQCSFNTVGNSAGKRTSRASGDVPSMGAQFDSSGGYPSYVATHMYPGAAGAGAALSRPTAARSPVVHPAGGRLRPLMHC